MRIAVKTQLFVRAHLCRIARPCRRPKRCMYVVRVPQTSYKNDDIEFLDELTVTCGVLIYTSCAPRTPVSVTLRAGRMGRCVHLPRDKAIGNNTPLKA